MSATLFDHNVLILSASIRTPIFTMQIVVFPNIHNAPTGHITVFVPRVLLFKLAAKIPGRTFNALSSSLAYLNISRNSFEGGMPLAPFLHHWREAASELAGADSSADGDDASNGSGAHWSAGASSSPLSYVNLSHNQFTGPIPEGIGTLTSLDTLDISCNKLQGGIPSGIGSCGALRVISLSRCGLSGRLDSDAEGGIGRLTSLESLRLDGNLFEGDVPSSLGRLTRLEVLQLQVDRQFVTIAIIGGNRGREGRYIPIYKQLSHVHS